MPTAIKVENLSKAYQLGLIGTGTISRDLERWVVKVRGKEDPFLKIGETNDRTTKGTSDVVWSLKDINFEIQQGDAVGIIGRNGAGKSTLLKILSRVTAPTTGTIKAKGRIASLLEVGTGFHPELSGRDNIYLNGAILGMRKKEIARKFDEILDFAGVERYIDTPVKRYSSGMYVRLAFAVAAHLDSEILIVDEVLAVGDIEFQKKAIGRMQDVSGKEGRTVLFVSHNLASLRSLCSLGILMDNGSITEEGPIVQILSNYEKSYNKNLSCEWTNYFDNQAAIYLNSVRVLDANKKVQANFISTEDVYIEMNVIVRELTKFVKIGFDLVKNTEIAFRSEQVDSMETSTLSPGNYNFFCRIPKNFLNEGEYAVVPQFSIHCVKSLIYANESVVLFKVKIDGSISDFHSILNEKNHPGIIYPALEWELCEAKQKSHNSSTQPQSN